MPKHNQKKSDYFGNVNSSHNSSRNMNETITPMKLLNTHDKEPLSMSQHFKAKVAPVEPTNNGRD